MLIENLQYLSKTYYLYRFFFQPLSAFKLGSISVQAFSDNGTHIYKRVSACLSGLGPIPPGEYYIFDRTDAAGQFA